MTCTICTLVGQFILNFLNLLDHTANWITLGDPDETLSSRTARARLAGSKAATKFCAFLTFAARIVTFGKVNQDHCDYALNPKELGDNAEIWSWSEGKILSTPETIIEDVQVSVLNLTSNSTNILKS